MEISITELKELIASATSGKTTASGNIMIGKYVIVRCRDAGVHAGVLESCHGREATLTESRRLWRFDPVGKSDGAGKWLGAVAVNGITNSSKVGPAVPRITLTENCEIAECSPKSENSIREIHND